MSFMAPSAAITGSLLAAFPISETASFKRWAASLDARQPNVPPAISECYTLEVLKPVFCGDAPSLATLAAATNDAGVKVLSTRAIKDFKP